MTALIEIKCGCSVSVDQDAKASDARFNHRLEFVTVCPAHAAFRGIAERWLSRTLVAVTSPETPQPLPWPVDVAESPFARGRNRR